jgi:hypothetical protein
LGDFLSWGTPPDPRQGVSCTSFSAVSNISHTKYGMMFG